MPAPGFDIRTVIHDGGFIMAPLVACSVIATIVLVERGIALFGAQRQGKRLARSVLDLARNGDLSRAGDFCYRSRSPLARIFDSALARVEMRAHAGPAVERARAAAAQELRRGLWILGTIGAAAPFVGLFGTVIGIIKSFQEIAATGQGGFATVAAGISEALIATGAGIAVAVVAFATHNYFQVKVAAILVEWKIRGEELLEAIDIAARRTRALARSRS